MLNRRQRVVVWSVAAITAIWVLVTIGCLFSQHAKMTADKVRAYAKSVDFGRLSATDRTQAIQTLADKLNALSPDERQQTRQDGTAYRWFDGMTEEEKGRFIDATMPTGFKQMLASFEQMPEDRRRRTVDQALKQLMEDRAGMTAQGRVVVQSGTNQPNVLSDELRQKATQIGLQTFYSQSSAKTKAELAPLLEEMQRMMQNGTLVMRSRPQQ